MIKFVTNSSYRLCTKITNYHVHLYYDGKTKRYAGEIRRELQRRYGSEIEIGRWRDSAPQGPHPMSHFQVSFPCKLFSELVPFLALNRRDLNILLHPNTGHDYEDHTNNVLWIGPSISLDQRWLRKNS